MAHTLYENFVLENKMTDIVNTNLDVNALFTVDNTLATEAGLTKYVNTYTYDATVEVLGKGAKNSDEAKGKVTFVSNPYTVKRYQQTFEYNDMDVMQDPYLLDVATTGAAAKMTNNIKDEYFAELGKITKSQEYDELTYDVIVDALAEIGREVESDMFLVMGLGGRAAIRHDNDYKSSRQGEILYTGQFGTIAGIPCLFTKHSACANGEVFLTTKDSIKFFVKKDGSVEQDRDIETKDNKVVYERHGVMAIVDQTKSIKLTKKA